MLLQLRGVARGQKVGGGVKSRSADSLRACAKTMNTRDIAGEGVQGSGPPTPEATREISANWVRNALGGVCVGSYASARWK